MYELSLAITHSHIVRGFKGNPCSCPIARALSEYFDAETYGVNVYPDFARIWKSNLRLICALDVNDFIAAYDNQEPVLPTTVHFYFQGV